MSTYKSPLTHYEDGLQVNNEHEGLQTKFHPTDQPEVYYNKGGSTRPQVFAPRDDARKSEIPFGLRPLTFGVLVALITAVVVGAAVGGGVGGALSQKASSSAPGTICPTCTTCPNVTSTSCPSNTSVPTANLVNYSPPAVEDVTSLAWNCVNDTTYTTKYEDPNQTFKATCGIDYLNSIPSTQGGVVADLVGVIVYSFDDCLEACSAYNRRSSIWHFDTVCNAVTFSHWMSSSVPKNGANCFLKNGTSQKPGYCANCLSAYLMV